MSEFLATDTSCKLYHKTTWFETIFLILTCAGFQVANYITKLRGLKLVNLVYLELLTISCKLYHKTTWFETAGLGALSLCAIISQIISQNYVV